MLFDLDEVKTEIDANECAEQLVVDAIKASEANRRKMAKIRSCSSKIKMLVKLCTTRGWSGPVKTVKKSFEMLEESKAEMDVNLFGI